MTKADSKRGSAIIEAAMIFPIVILIVACIMAIGLEYKERVEETSLMHIANTDEKIDDLDFFTETELRTKWEVKKAFR